MVHRKLWTATAAVSLGCAMLAPAAQAAPGGNPPPIGEWTWSYKWKKETRYQPGAVVRYQGAVYAARSASKGTPPRSNSGKWVFIVKNGKNGTNGTNGTNGKDGARGAAGAVGATGAAGAVGATGAAGAVGAAGATGATGAMGVAGMVGATGATGASGATGAAGTDGATGATGAAGTAGTDGATGATGAAGATGLDGATGPTGPTGPAGASGSGAFTSSGGPTSVTTTVGGASNVTKALPLNGQIDFQANAGNAADLLSVAQIIPKDVTISGISAYGQTTSALALVGTTITVTATLWTGSTPDSGSAVAGVNCLLTPALTGIVAQNTLMECATTGLSVPVSAGKYAWIVIRADVTAGLDTATSIGLSSGASITTS